MKILQIADTHAGVRKNNIHFYNHQKNFIEKVFLPIIDKFKPDAIVHLGDVVDNRNGIEFRTHEHLINDFINPMRDINIPQYWLVGNHDSYYKNSLKINAVDKFVKHGIVVSKPEDIRFKDETFCFIPWICEDNYDESMAVIKESKAKHCFGHLEVKNFEMSGGSICTDGIESSLFSHFEGVYSGHFHKRSKSGNINYIGGAFQFDWSDCNQYRGIALLDTETNDIKYYKNPVTMFNMVEYYEGKEIDISKFPGTYVRVICKEKTSEAKFNDFINKIEDLGVANLSIVDQTIEPVELTEMNLDVDEVKDVCDNYISSLEIENKDDVKNLFESLYQGCLK